jgi:hypothetical protein
MSPSFLDAQHLVAAPLKLIRDRTNFGDGPSLGAMGEDLNSTDRRVARRSKIILPVQRYTMGRTTKRSNRGSLSDT